MSTSTSGRTWDEASAPGATRLARRFEHDWRSAPSSRRPRLDDYLPVEPGSCPGARLALLRVEMNLRAEYGEPVRVEDFSKRYGDLSDETLVALIYEEFCLREEAGETPELDEYQARFPEVAAPLRRVFDIHGLIGSSPENLLDAPPSSGPISLPETGQTIAGFHLVDELGRGAFARVFLAEERQLADRPVALKVARNGSREPNTLARLQHTHIVPIYSYRTDPATGLHLLCMPYLGGVTLAELYADAKARASRTGGDLLKALDRLEPSPEARPGRASGRQALEGRSYVRAIAWWGARLAEALSHAHERGVLHRDVKPSNILVTSDGLPMLLDFNLAWESRLDDPAIEPGALGGTLAYMAPEHLEALADGITGTVDARSDIYALGVVLYEAMGSRPFAPLAGAGSLPHALLRAADDRRIHIPSLAEEHPDLPIEFDAVVAKCLAPDPSKRYANAADLAADLQAVADDAPLRTARIPIAWRASGWIRRHKGRLTVGATLLLVATVLGITAVRSRIAVNDRLEGVNNLILEGKSHASSGDFLLAMNKFETASKLSDGWQAASLDDAHRRSRELFSLAQQTLEERRRADDVFARSEELRYGLLGIVGRPADSFEETLAALHIFFVLESPISWTERADMRLLDEGRKVRLIETIDDLMFLWTVAQYFPDGRDMPRAEPGEVDIRKMLDVCDRAIAFSPEPGPWHALRQWVLSAESGATAGALPVPALASVQSSQACFHWAALRLLQNRPDEAVAWLERAARLDPGNYWVQCMLSYVHAHDRHDTLAALSHIEAAVALRPRSESARFERAKLEFTRGDRLRALDDLESCLRLLNADDDAKTPVYAPAQRKRRSLRVWLTLGNVHQAVGDVISARRNYSRLIRATEPDGALHEAAVLNVAKLDADAGRPRMAIEAYDALLVDNPRNADARLGRAMTALRLGDAENAEGDLKMLLQDRPGDPALLALRARASLMLGRLDDARKWADNASVLAPSPLNRRLLTRIALAGAPAEALIVEDPADFAALPGPEVTLRHDLERILHRPPPRSLEGRLQHAVILSFLGRHAEAERLASILVEERPRSVLSLRVRAQIRIQAEHWDAAREDVDHALAIEPHDPRLRLLSGRIHAKQGRTRSALGRAGPGHRRGSRCRTVRGACPALDASRSMVSRDPGLETGPSNWTWIPRPISSAAPSCMRELGSPRDACAELQLAADCAEDHTAVWRSIVSETRLICRQDPAYLPLFLVYGTRYLESRFR